MLLTTGLVLVWAMPAVVAVQVWYWMTNFQNGVLNYILTELRVGDFFQHDWYASTFSQLAMVTLLIVWGAIPFVAIAVYAGLAQVPRELVEAAEIDGAGPLRVFRDVTFPTIRPILLILTSLSIIWDFGVFAQPYLLIGASHMDASNYLMGVYVYIEGYAHSDFGRGAAISILMLLIVAVLSVFYVRGMVRRRRRRVSTRPPPRRARRRRRRTWRRVRRRGWDVVGLALFVVLVFPVFWMISTAFKPDDEINSAHADVVLALADARSLPRRDGPAVLLGHGAEQPDRRLRHGRRVDRARVPRRGRAREVPVHRAASCSSS